MDEIFPRIRNLEDGDEEDEDEEEEEKQAQQEKGCDNKNVVAERDTMELDFNEITFN